MFKNHLRHFNTMNGIWDIKTDAVKKGDNLRDVLPLTNETRIDEIGFTHYVFSKLMFNNPWYTIPDDDLKLFKKFLDGGSRAYPSDGNIPSNIVAKEARIVLNKIVEYANDPNHFYYKDARETSVNGKFALVRGTMKIYLGKYTMRDWRRKRFTDDIDFWVFNVYILEHALKQTGWTKNKNTGEWEKQVEWINPYTNERRENILFAANNLNQLLDFGAGSYLEGTSLKNEFNKKIKRGHDVDLSDILNIAMLNNGTGGQHVEEWLEAWTAFEEAANTRNTSITANIISLCRYSLAIADHIEKVGKSLKKYHELIFDKSEYPDSELSMICRPSTHWVDFLVSNGPDATRKMLHDFIIEQAEERPQYSRNLRDFSKKVLDLLNSKYIYLKIAFEIEN